MYDLQSNNPNTPAGYAVPGGAMLGANTPRQPRMDQVAERIEKSLAEFQQLTQRLGSMADRLLGPIPEAVSNDKAPINPNNAMNRLESLTEVLQHLLRRLHQSTERLETL